MRIGNYFKTSEVIQIEAIIYVCGHFSGAFQQFKHLLSAFQISIKVHITQYIRRARGATPSLDREWWQAEVLWLKVLHGGEDLSGGQEELLGDLVVRDHHHLHPRRQTRRHAVGSVLKHQAVGGVGRVWEPGEREGQSEGGGDVGEDVPGGTQGEYLRRRF